MPRHHPEVLLRGDHNECPTCGELFNSTAAFDRHRAGSHAKDTRHCLTVGEMTQRGMVRNATGWWIASKRPDVDHAEPRE